MKKVAGGNNEFSCLCIAAETERKPSGINSRQTGHRRYSGKAVGELRVAKERPA